MASNLTEERNLRPEAKSSHSGCRLSWFLSLRAWGRRPELIQSVGFRMLPGLGSHLDPVESLG